MSGQPSQGITLVLAYLFGIFGADKFYLGLTNQGIIMLILTLTVFGLFATVPWALLSSLFLVIGILWNGKPMLYPDNIKWAPLTQTDKTIAWIIVGITAVGIISSPFISAMRNKDSDKEKDKEKNK